MSIGFRVFTERILPQKDLVEEYKSLPAANVADCWAISALSDPKFVQGCYEHQGRLPVSVKP